MATNKSSDKFQEVLKNDTATLSFTNHIKEKYKVGWVNPSPCMEACPAGVNVKSYVSLIAAGKFHDALKVVRERNPLPGICGRICTHPCESFCNRNEIDESVAICWLKRFIADYELKNPMSKPEKTTGKRRENIAIIGSGPAGLTAGHDLALLGYKVTIFEELSEPGGMLVAGIPAYRMPRDILKFEIDYIKDLGVEIKTNTRIKGKNAVEGLIQKGYSSVFIAIGAHKGKKLNIPGEEDFEGFLDAVTFLRGVNFDEPKKPGEKVIVIGGGNSAIDAARTAIRLNCEDVNIVYRRTRNEMPANDAEIEEAENEGVNIHYLASPVNIIGKNGKVSGMECVKMELGEPDDSGRRRPIPIKDSEYVINADVIIPAVSQEPDLTFLPNKHKLNISKWNTLVANKSTMETNIPGVFAGGDAVTGPNTVIDAIAQGHIAAESIDRFVSGKSQNRTAFPTRQFETEVQRNFKAQPKTKRAEMPMEDIKSRTTNFDEVEFGFEEAQAIAEAQRCLRCGPCSECYTCVPDCDKGLAILSNEDGDCLFRYPPNFSIQENQNQIIQGELKSKGTGTVSFQVNSVVPSVQEKLCRGCGDCLKVCEYSACELVPIGDDVFISRINPDICRGCGTCVAYCPSSAIKPGHYTSNWLEYKLKNIQPNTKNVVVFSCHWNGSTFDMKTGKTNVIFINTMCTGRIETTFILKALELGADGVLVTGCSTDECHYEFGANKFIETYDKTKKLANMLGIDDKIIGYSQIPEGKTDKFIESVNGFIKQL